MGYLQPTVRCSEESYRADRVVYEVGQRIVVCELVCQQATERVTWGQIDHQFSGHECQFVPSTRGFTMLTLNL